MNILEITVRRLFREMDSAGVRYAVLRNHEYLFSLRKPNSASISDIDLIVDSRDLDLFRHIIVNTAMETGWDSASECDHWAQSPLLDHNIEVFRLYSKDPLVCLEVDVFHAFLVNGVPLFDEQQFLARRWLDPVRHIMRIDPHHENAIRIVQILTLDDSPRKRERYRQRLIAHVSDHRREFLETLLERLGPFIRRGVWAILENDLRRAKRYTDLARAWFLAKYSLQHPLGSAKRLFYRVLDHADRFYLNQCGCVARFHASDPDVRSMVHSVLDEMVVGNLINEWSASQSGRISVRQHIRLEQSSLLLRWMEPEGCDIDFQECESRAEVVCLLVDFLASRHAPLMPSRTAVGVAERV